jgi:hypothetical protein
MGWECGSDGKTRNEYWNFVEWQYVLGLRLNGIGSELCPVVEFHEVVNLSRSEGILTLKWTLSDILVGLLKRGIWHSQDLYLYRTAQHCKPRTYEGVSKSFRTGHLERELQTQMVLLSATWCSCIAILWVSLVSFAAITLCVAPQRVIPKG